ncbi:N-acylneuraminate cytidylyltransferase [Lachnospiraceae bacterium XBB2008]|nr:N-acylneuraminate cytidylyltransferase [Lachnospiraceae bacterium XBB2008]
MNIAFIPVRGGSKSIPLKNIKGMAGHPLVWWTAKAANDCELIETVYVSTDSEIIKKTVESFNLPKVIVVDRSTESASDTASTESVMLEFAENHAFDNLVLIQATSPLLTSEDLMNGFSLYFSPGTDSVLSVVRQKRFIWKENEFGFSEPVNYDVYSRPRRQEFDGYLVENGAFYITSRENLLSSKNRISGNISAYEMHENSYVEIDEPSDWIIVENILSDRNKTDKQCVKNLDSPYIKMFLSDCDGVLTDAGMYYSEFGDELKKFNTRDGMGFSMLREQGIITGIITSENRELNTRRAQKLNVDEICQGVSDKLQVIKAICQKYRITLNEVAYIGDDINDLEAIKSVGVGCCPADADSRVREAAIYITQAKGGEGAVRETAEKILLWRSSVDHSAE